MYQQPLNRKSSPWVWVGYRAATGLPWKIVRRFHTQLVKLTGGFERPIWGFLPFCHLSVRAHPGFWHATCRLRGATCGLYVGFTACSNSSHGVSSAYLRAFKLVMVTPAIFPLWSNDASEDTNKRPAEQRCFRKQRRQIKKGELARALLWKINTPKFRGATVLPKTLTNKKKRRTPELEAREFSSFFHSQTLTPFLAKAARGWLV